MRRRCWRRRRRRIVCRSNERENYGLIYEREKENCLPTAKAGAQSRVPVPSPPPRHRGRRGRWGQARPMGAASRHHARVHQHRRLRKPPGQIPSQQCIYIDYPRFREYIRVEKYVSYCNTAVEIRIETMRRLRRSR